VTVLTCGETHKQLVIIDYRRKVGEIMVDLALYLGLEDALDFRIILHFGGRQRLLDQDEVLFDLIGKYDFPVEEKEDANRHSRYSFNVTTIQKEEGFFSFISEVFANKVDSCLAFRKIVYLPKEIEIASAMRSPRRGKYIAEELFSRLAKGEIGLEADDWAEAGSVWLLLNHFNSLRASPISHLLTLITDNLIPPEKKSISSSKLFYKVFGDSIERFKKLEKMPEPSTLYRTIIRVFYRSVRTYTYVAPFTPHTVPAHLFHDCLGPLGEECWLGVNFKELLVFRRWESDQAVVKLSLQDIKLTCSTFSLFVEYSPEIGTTESHLAEGLSRTVLRFDGRLLYHFRYMVKLYLNLRRIFPSSII
jgi:hypothetical protein